MGDRRIRERRTTGEMPATTPDDKRGCHDRRAEDRRESPRVPVSAWVRDLTSDGQFEEHTGDIGLGGMYFTEKYAPSAGLVEVRFRLPGTERDILCKGEILGVSVDKANCGYRAHLRFVDLDVASELAIAKYVDDHAVR